MYLRSVRVYVMLWIEWQISYRSKNQRNKNARPLLLLTETLHWLRYLDKSYWYYMPSPVRFFRIIASMGTVIPVPPVPRLSPCFHLRNLMEYRKNHRNQQGCHIQRYVVECYSYPMAASIWWPMFWSLIGAALPATISPWDGPGRAPGDDLLRPASFFSCPDFRLDLEGRGLALLGMRCLRRILLVISSVDWASAMNRSIYFLSLGINVLSVLDKTGYLKDANGTSSSK